MKDFQAFVVQLQICKARGNLLHPSANDTDNKTIKINITNNTERDFVLTILGMWNSHDCSFVGHHSNNLYNPTQLFIQLNRTGGGGNMTFLINTNIIHRGASYAAELITHRIIELHWCSLSFSIWKSKNLSWWMDLSIHNHTVMFTR